MTSMSFLVTSILLSIVEILVIALHSEEVCILKLQNKCNKKVLWNGMPFIPRIVQHSGVFALEC